MRDEWEFWAVMDLLRRVQQYLLRDYSGITDAEASARCHAWQIITQSRIRVIQSM